MFLCEEGRGFGLEGPRQRCGWGYSCTGWNAVVWRAAGCFSVLWSIKWDKDSLLDQFYSVFSEFSSQVGPDFLNSMVVCMLPSFSGNPTLVTFPESPVFTIWSPLIFDQVPHLPPSGLARICPPYSWCLFLVISIPWPHTRTPCSLAINSHFSSLYLESNPISPPLRNLRLSW